MGTFNLNTIKASKGTFTGVANTVTTSSSYSASGTTSYANTGYGVSITPSSASSKFLIQVSYRVGQYNASETVARNCQARIVRSISGSAQSQTLATDLNWQYDNFGSRSYFNSAPPTCWTYVDAPSTSNTVNYWLHVAATSSSHTHYASASATNPNTWTVMEF